MTMVKKKHGKCRNQAFKKRKSQIASAVEDALEVADFKGYSPRTRESLSYWFPDSIGFNLIEHVLCHIVKKERPGAVLVFMTGWDDINSLKDKLQAHPLLGDQSRVLLLACHGSMASSEQGARCKDHFIKWCDDPIDDSELQPPLLKYPQCECGAGVCRKLKETDGTNGVKYYFACPIKQGFPKDGAAECVDSYKHMSVIVVLNSVELLVDLMRFPGKLLPQSIKSILMTHISAAGESDSAENDSCDSPLEPNSPLYEVSESPEHPLFQAHGRSKLGGDKTVFRDFADDQATSRSSYKSDGASSSEARRIRRSISITPEIGDDIARQDICFMIVLFVPPKLV